MFSRLLKHEWKASAGILGILSLAVLVMGIADTVVLRLMLDHSNYMGLISRNPTAFEMIASAAMSMFLFFSVIAISLYVVAVQVILLYRFYKNKFTDEGYLTFTLPVKTSHIFWSSVVNMLLWMLISFAVVLAVVCMLIFFCTVTDGINTQVFELIRSVIEFYRGDPWEQVGVEFFGKAYLVLAGLSALVSPLYALFVPMCCITIGAVLAKKYKLLASFGIYYGVNFVVGIITSVAGLVPTLLLLSSENMVAYNTATAAIQLVITTALTLGAYFLTIHLMKRKLNLP